MCNQFVVYSALRLYLFVLRHSLQCYLMLCISCVDVDVNCVGRLHIGSCGRQLPYLLVTVNSLPCVCMFTRMNIVRRSRNSSRLMSSYMALKGFYYYKYMAMTIVKLGVRTIESLLTF